MHGRCMRIHGVQHQTQPTCEKGCLAAWIRLYFTVIRTHFFDGCGTEFAVHDRDHDACLFKDGAILQDGGDAVTAFWTGPLVDSESGFGFEGFEGLDDLFLGGFDKGFHAETHWV